MKDLHEAMELVPRLIIGALLANTSMSWAQLAIDVNNALCQGVGEVALPAWESADGTTQLLVNVIAVLIYLVTSLLLLLQMLMRLALIDVLLVSALDTSRFQCRARFATASSVLRNKKRSMPETIWSARSPCISSS